VKPNNEVVQVVLLSFRFFDFVLLESSGQIAAAYFFTMYLVKLVKKVKN